MAVRCEEQEQVSGHLDGANLRVEGNLDCSVHQYPCQVATQHQLTCLQAQEPHYPSQAWFELLDVFPCIKQKIISIEVLPTVPALPFGGYLLPQSHTVQTWRQCSAFIPIKPLLSDQKLSCCNHLPRTGAAGSSFAEVSDALVSMSLTMGHGDIQSSLLAEVWGESHETASQGALCNQGASVGSQPPCRMGLPN